jgi:hypothetical protein
MRRSSSSSCTTPPVTSSAAWSKSACFSEPMEMYNRRFQRAGERPTA